MIVSVTLLHFLSDRVSRRRGFSGSGFDRVVERLDENSVSKLQQQYWEAKQIYLKNIKRKEDDCIVASDSELDAKLEVSTSGSS